MAFQALTSGTVYAALGTALSSQGVLSEQNGAGYARVAITVQYDPLNGNVAFPAGVTFAATGTWAQSNYLALWDSPTGGNMLFVFAIPGVTLTSGQTYAVPAGAFNFLLNPALIGANKQIAAFNAVGTVTGALGNAAGNIVYNGAALAGSASGVLAAQTSTYNPLNQSPIQFRNVLDGGDFTVNPFQRNVPGLASGGVLSTAITSTPGYFADRFFGVGGGSSAILFASVANVTVPGFSTALQFQRQSGNANTAAIYMGQIIETADSIRLQGQQVTLSFWAAVGANYSGGNLTVQVVSGTGSNQSAANAVAATWTGQTNVINSAAGLTTTMQRFQFVGTVPTNCTQLGVLFSFTPSGTAGANDWVQFMGVQLEQGAVASPFEHRDAQVELEICQRYAWLSAEPAAGVILGAGMNTGASAQTFYMAAPVQFYKPPTVTVAAGTFKTNQSGTPTTATIAAGATHTVNAISVTSNSAGTAGQATLLQGGGGSGWILASADF